MWEIAGNLHRLDLSKEQRDERIRRYAEHVEAKRQTRQSVAIESKRDDGRGHQRKGMARQVAEATGLSVDTVRRAITPPANVVLEVHERNRARLMSAPTVVTFRKGFCGRTHRINVSDHRRS